MSLSRIPPNQLIFHFTLLESGTSTCVKYGQNVGICIYNVASSELAHPSGRYTTSLGASKSFEEKITQGGVLGII